jgi:hypothetical protein
VLVLSFHSSYLRHSDDLSCKTQNGATVIGASIIAGDAMNIEIARQAEAEKEILTFDIPDACAGASWDYRTDGLHFVLLY